MLLSQSFSSLIEINNAPLNNTAADMLNGLKLLHEGQWYICGNLALNEGQSPHKLINSSPNDVDYQLLVKAAILLVADSVEQPITITTGFPYSTYRIYKDIAAEALKKTHMIEYDASWSDSRFDSRLDEGAWRKQYSNTSPDGPCDQALPGLSIPGRAGTCQRECSRGSRPARPDRW